MTLEHNPDRRQRRQRKHSAPLVPLAFTVDEFCDAHRISRTHLYAMWRRGLGPRYMLTGAKRLITTEAAADWRAEGENSPSIIVMGAAVAVVAEYREVADLKGLAPDAAETAVDPPTREPPTLERLALISLRERFPDMQRRGFSAAVREACGCELTEKVSFIPDGWFAEGDYRTGEERGEPATFTCVEIEDSNPLSPEKLWSYCHLADMLDFCGHNLRLFVFDRYGHNERELDLIGLYLRGIVEMYGPKRARSFMK